MKKLGVVFITWNRLNYTEITLPKLIKALPKDSHLLVIDNGSTDNTRAYLQTQKRIDHLALWDENRGVAEAMNASFQHFRDLGVEYYCKIDNDFECKRHSLTNAIEFLEQAPNMDAVGLPWWKKEDVQHVNIKSNPAGEKVCVRTKHTGGNFVMKSIMLERGNIDESITERTGNKKMGFTEWQWRNKIQTGYEYPFVFHRLLDDPRDPISTKTQQWANKEKGMTLEKYVRGQKSALEKHLTEYNA